jgi:hypothetical protein
MRLEAVHAPQYVAASSDVSPYFRFFGRDEVRALIERIERRVAAGKATALRPETALLVTKALKQWNAEPARSAIVREICGVQGGCETQCLACVGKANAIMGLYDGRKVR